MEHLLLCFHFTGQDAETGGRVQWLSSISQLVPAIIETVTLIVNSLLSILLSGLHFLPLSHLFMPLTLPAPWSLPSSCSMLSPHIL